MTKAESSVIRGKNGYVEYGTQKSGTYFTTPAMKRAASDYAEFTKAYEKTQNGLVKEVVEICGACGRSTGEWPYTHSAYGSLFLQPPTSLFSRIWTHS